jgi:hypothetical protein
MRKADSTEELTEMTYRNIVREVVKARKLEPIWTPETGWTDGKGVSKMNQQPEWETVYATDCEKLSIDKTGVYPPELTIIDDLGESTEELDGQFLMHRVVLEPCTFENGILSDNKFHMDLPAWFADKIEMAAQSSGREASELIRLLTSDKPGDLASAYGDLISYFGAGEWDSHPVYLTEEEATEALLA